jgi:hypothetical protein
VTLCLPVLHKLFQRALRPSLVNFVQQYDSITAKDKLITNALRNRLSIADAGLERLLKAPLALLLDHRPWCMDDESGHKPF